MAYNSPLTLGDREGMGVMTCACSPSIGRLRQEDCFKFEVNLVSMTSCRLTRATP